MARRVFDGMTSELCNSQEKMVGNHFDLVIYSNHLHVHLRDWNIKDNICCTYRMTCKIDEFGRMQPKAAL